MPTPSRPLRELFGDRKLTVIIEILILPFTEPVLCCDVALLVLYLRTSSFRVCTPHLRSRHDVFVSETVPDETSSSGPNALKDLGTISVTLQRVGERTFVNKIHSKTLDLPGEHAIDEKLKKAGGHGTK